MKPIKTAILFTLYIPFCESFAASFDCETAKLTTIEKTICSDALLSKLDEALSEAYKKVRENHSNPSALKSDQLNWIKKNRNSCSTSECLIQSYTLRIGELAQLNEDKSEGNPDKTPVLPKPPIDRGTIPIPKLASNEPSTIQEPTIYSDLEGFPEEGLVPSKHEKYLQELRLRSENGDHEAMLSLALELMSDENVKLKDLPATKQLIDRAETNTGTTSDIEMYRSMYRALENKLNGKGTFTTYNVPPVNPEVSNTHPAATHTATQNTKSNEEWCRSLASQMSNIVVLLENGMSIEMLEKHIKSQHLSKEDELQYLSSIPIAITNYSHTQPSTVFQEEYRLCLQANN